MVEMLPQIAQWTEEIEAYDKNARQPIQWVSQSPAPYAHFSLSQALSF